MIKIRISKTYPKIELIKTNSPNTYINFYVDGKNNSRLSFTYYQQISLDEILNSKSISLEYISVRTFWTNFR